MINKSKFRLYTTMLVLSFSTAFLFEACGKEPQEPQEPKDPVGVITMTTKASEVSFHIELTARAGNSSNLTIDWGDGEVRKITDATSNIFSRSYSDTSERRITITGDNIKSLMCRNSQLTALDVSRNTALEDLDCRNNQLTTLDVSNNTALTRLDCNYNQITKLDVSENSALILISCVGNQLTAPVLNDLFRILPNYSGLDGIGAAIFISTRINPGSEFNNPGTLDCDRSIAVKKGWVFRTDR